MWLKTIYLLHLANMSTLVQEHKYYFSIQEEMNSSDGWANLALQLMILKKIHAQPTQMMY